ncbi:MAG: hypothetical protein D6679_02360 [Candidatus Hydrogenedentota bacterium]|nr:MAG: hypothetical protein D6679_02360 [Candidatus Hydrogenedentota bacterium]
MVIDQIGALNNIQAAYQNQIRKTTGTDAKEEKKSDRVELKDGRAKADLRKALAEAVEKVPGSDPRSAEVRMDRVEAARKKLQEGTLITDQVIEEIADRIADFFIRG